MSSIMNLIRIEGVKGYVDENNMVWCDASDIAFGLGFYFERKGYSKKCATSCTKNEAKDLSISETMISRETYYTVRWKTINKYLKEMALC